MISNETVMKYIYDFCAGNGYREALKALQRESHVPYTTALKDLSALRSAFESRYWDDVLRTVDAISLPRALVEELYIAIVDDLSSRPFSTGAALAIVTHASVFKDMKQTSAERYQALVERCRVREEVAPPSHEYLMTLCRRIEHAVSFCTEEERRQKSLLLPKLLLRALHPELEYALPSPSGEQTVGFGFPYTVGKRLDVGTAVACVAVLSPSYVFAGTEGGAVVVWNLTTEQRTEFPPHRSVAVTAVAGEAVRDAATWVIAGYRDGVIRIFDASAGLLVRKIEPQLWVNVRMIALTPHINPPTEVTSEVRAVLGSHSASCVSLADGVLAVVDFLRASAIAVVQESFSAVTVRDTPSTLVVASAGHALRAYSYHGGSLSMLSTVNLDEAVRGVTVLRWIPTKPLVVVGTASGAVFLVYASESSGLTLRKNVFAAEGPARAIGQASVHGIDGDEAHVAVLLSSGMLQGYGFLAASEETSLTNLFAASINTLLGESKVVSRFTLNALVSQLGRWRWVLSQGTASIVILE